MTEVALSLKKVTFSLEKSEKLICYLLARYTVESSRLVLDVGVEIRPELHEEEGYLRSFVVQLLEAAFLLRELVVNLPHVHCLQEGIRVRRRTSYVDEQVLVVLKTIFIERLSHYF